MKTYKTKSIECTDKGVEYVYEDHYQYNFREIPEDDSSIFYRHDTSISLDPCPFCGVAGILNQDPHKCFGWCSICGCEGPKHWDWRVAARLWNARSLKEYQEISGFDVNKIIEDGFDIDRISEKDREELGIVKGD